MTLRQLQYFVRIAQTGSFSAAAEALHIAQSALSRHIKELEEEVGGALLERGPRGVTLSDSGRIFYARARYILSQVDDARTEVLAHNRELTGVVRLMTPSSISQLMFDSLVDRFLAAFPKVRLDLTEGLWDEAESALRSGAADVAIMSGVETEHIELEPLAYEQMVLVGRVEDPLMARKSIAVEALAGLQLMMPEVTLEMLRRSAPLLIDKFDVRVLVSSAAAARELTSRGRGYAVAPRSILLGTLENRPITSVPIRHLEVLRSMGTLRGRPMSRGLRELSDAVRQEFAGYIKKGIMRPLNGR